MSFPDYEQFYTLVRQWTQAITRQESDVLLDAALGDGVLYKVRTGQLDEHCGCGGCALLKNVLVQAWPTGDNE